MQKVLALCVALWAAIFSMATPAMATGATGPDFTTLTSAVDFTSTGDAIQTVGALAIGLALVFLGIRVIMRVVRGAS